MLAACWAYVKTAPASLVGLAPPTFGDLAERIQHASGARFDCRPRPVWQYKASG
jgi:hypothetical protein